LETLKASASPAIVAPLRQSTLAACNILELEGRADFRRDPKRAINTIKAASEE
jgi:hypothetical protein